MAVVFDSNSNQATKTGATLDRAAICVSAVCLAQCLLLPVLVVLTPLVSVGFLAGEVFHFLLLFVIVPLSLAAFLLGYRTHRSARMLVPGAIGLVLVAIAALHETVLLSDLAAAVLTSLGGGFLIVGHWLNLRDRRRVCLQPPR